MNPMPGLCPGPAGDPGGLQTPCHTRNETLVMAMNTICMQLPSIDIFSFLIKL
jgi:hypothetical protein